MNIREMVNDIINQITPDMHYVEATDKLVQLSRLTGNIGEAIIEREREYIRKHIEIMADKMPVNKAKLLSQDTDEYVALQEAKVLRESVIETVRALKYRCRALAEERSITVD